MDTDFTPPRAGRDPIDRPATARALLDLLFPHTTRHETAVVPLDQTYVGAAAVVVSGTDPPSRELEVVEFVAGAAAASARRLLVASCRPGGRPIARDADQWAEMDQCCEAHGLELLEWYVVGSGTWCPRDLFGVPARWPAVRT